MTLNYKKTFDQKEKVWTVDLNYNLGDDNENSNIKQYALEGLAFNTADLMQFPKSKENQKSFIGQTDFSLPLKNKIKIDLGAKTSIKDITNDYQVQEADSAGNLFLLNDFSNQFSYQENVYAAYTTFSKQYDKLSYQLGLRMEHSEINTELLTTGEKHNKSYTDLFPSFALTYKLKNKNSLQWNYSRRISRPRTHFLNPFHSYSDSRNIRSGNPDLNPVYTNSFEMGYLKYWEKSSIYAGTFYRRSTDVFQRISTVNDSGITLSIPVNLSTGNSAGLEANISKTINKKIKLSGSASAFYSVTKGQYENQYYDAESFSWYARMTAKYSLDKLTNIQLNGMYRAPRKGTQGKVKSISILNLAASRDILKTKGTITFSVQDIFNSRKWRSVTEGTNFYSVSEFQWRPRQFMLTFNYRFNQDKSKKNNPMGGNQNQGMDDSDGGY